MCWSMLLNLATCAYMLTLTKSMVLELVLAYLSSAVHVVEPVFYAVYARYCTGKFVLFSTKG